MITLYQRCWGHISIMRCFCYWEGNISIDFNGVTHDLQLNIKDVPVSDMIVSQSKEIELCSYYE